MDKRVKKTLRTIQKGVHELYILTNNKKYSVTELCNKIGLQRSCFYNHYSSIEEVIVEIQNKCLDDLEEILSNPKSTNVDIIIGCVNYISERRKKKFNSLFEINDMRVFERLKNMCTPLIINSQQRNMLLNDAQKDYLVTFVVSGSIAVFRKWVEDGYNVDPYQLLDGFLKSFKLIY